MAEEGVVEGVALGVLITRGYSDEDERLCEEVLLGVTLGVVLGVAFAVALTEAEVGCELLMSANEEVFAFLEVGRYSIESSANIM